MGRAMLIIVAGVLISLGITQTSVFGGLNNLAGHSANYAEATQAQNIAYMGTEFAIQRMIDEPTWRNGEESFTVGGGEVAVSVEETGTDSQIRLVSIGRFAGEIQQISLLLEESENSPVPTFFAALGLMFEHKWELDKFNISGGGSYKDRGNFDGTDMSGTCPDVPGVAVMNDDVKSHEGLQDHESHFGGNPPLGVNSDMNFDDISKLIDGLVSIATPENYLNGDVDQDKFGPLDENGVPAPNLYIVDNTKAEIKGGAVGSGILLVRSSGEVDVELEAELTLKGNPEFHGLVIFENAFALDSRGAVEIFGSVLVGKTNAGAKPFNIDFRGTGRIKYDCEAQKYADMAASSLSHRRFAQQSVYQTAINPNNISSDDDGDDGLLNGILKGLL